MAAGYLADPQTPLLLGCILIRNTKDKAHCLGYFKSGLYLKKISVFEVFLNCFAMRQIKKIAAVACFLPDFCQCSNLSKQSLKEQI